MIPAGSWEIEMKRKYGEKKALTSVGFKLSSLWRRIERNGAMIAEVKLLVKKEETKSRRFELPMEYIP